MQTIPTFQHTREQLEQAVTGHRKPGQVRRALPSDVLDQAYAPVREALNRVRDNLLNLCRHPSPFLSKLLGHVLDAKGKQLRPAITLLAAQFHPNDGKTAEVMASAIELLHIATLIHDDTVDNSDIRRGKATVSSLWGRNAAVLFGDYVFATSATYVCDTGNVRVIRRFSETIMELSAGELRELEKAFNHSHTREDYFQRIYDKTASLFTTAGESGALLSGAPESVAQSLKAYGYNLGMAFQIVDDILDFGGTTEEVGKPVGNDLAQGIVTLPAIIALERHGDASPINEYFKRPGDRERLERAVESTRDPSIVEESYAVAADYCGQALDSLAPLEESPARDSLESLVAYVVWRRS